MLAGRQEWQGKGTIAIVPARGEAPVRFHEAASSLLLGEKRSDSKFSERGWHSGRNDYVVQIQMNEMNKEKRRGFLVGSHKRKRVMFMCLFFHLFSAQLQTKATIPLAVCYSLNCP